MGDDILIAVLFVVFFAAIFDKEFKDGIKKIFS